MRLAVLGVGRGDRPPAGLEIQIDPTHPRHFAAALRREQTNLEQRRQRGADGAERITPFASWIVPIVDRGLGIACALARSLQCDGGIGAELQPFLFPLEPIANAELNDPARQDARSVRAAVCRRNPARAPPASARGGVDR